MHLKILLRIDILHIVPEEFVKREFDKICGLSIKNDEFEKITNFFKDNFINNSKKYKDQIINFLVGKWTYSSKNCNNNNKYFDAYQRNLNSKIIEKIKS